MRRCGLAVALMIVAALALVGCGDFRQRAMEAQQVLEDAQRAAETAEQAAARNTSRILELEHRIDSLEVRLNEVQGTPQDAESNSETSP